MSQHLGESCTLLSWHTPSTSCCTTNHPINPSWPFLASSGYDSSSIVWDRHTQL
jgi:hypothetical protein